MTNLKVPGTAPLGPAGDLDGDLATLRGDCARMAGNWAAPTTASALPGGPGGLPVSPSLIRGVTVPSTSARMLDEMSDYGD
ncbi:hypothetical protein ACFYPT_02150 [Streptomyces sp. NPDC005529]|uniref:hypothetical protein n=1 Tax=unclassified Streptomyces TaxID=2593676 RepID=UPI0033B60615